MNIKTQQKFNDDFRSRCMFSGEFLVRCPKCSGKAKVILSVPWTSKNFHTTKIKIICYKCGYHKQKFPGKTICIYTNRDWYFNFPLYYTIETKFGNLYAYNEEHLYYLEKYISAKIRVRRKNDEFGWCNKSQISRLPKWVKLAKNRKSIMLAITKLRAKNSNRIFTM